MDAYGRHFVRFADNAGRNKHPSTRFAIRPTLQRHVMYFLLVVLARERVPWQLPYYPFGASSSGFVLSGEPSQGRDHRGLVHLDRKVANRNLNGTPAHVLGNGVESPYARVRIVTEHWLEGVLGQQPVEIILAH